MNVRNNKTLGIPTLEVDSLDDMGRKAKKRPGKPTVTDETEKEQIRGVVNMAINRFGSASKVALVLDVSQPTVSNWSNGVSVPGVDNVRRLAEVLAMTEDEVRHGLGKRALDVAWAYWKPTNRWPEEILRRAKAMEESGAVHHPQGWTDLMDQLLVHMTSPAKQR